MTKITVLVLMFNLLVVGARGACPKRGACGTAGAEDGPTRFLVGDGMALQVYNEVVCLSGLRSSKLEIQSSFNETATEITARNGFPLQFFGTPRGKFRFLRINSLRSRKEASDIARLASDADLAIVSMSLHAGSRSATTMAALAFRRTGVRVVIMEPSFRHVRAKDGSCKPSTRPIFAWLKSMRRKSRIPLIPWTEQTRGMHEQHVPVSFSKLDEGRCVHWCPGSDALTGIAKRIMAL